MKFFIALLAVSLIFGFFIFFDSVQAQQEEFAPPDGGGGTGEEGNGEEEEEECIPGPTECSWTCSSDCDGTLTGYCSDGCSSWTEEIKGSPWQKCDASLPGFYCDGSCLEAPENPRYYDNPTYSDQPDKDIGDSDIKLPVKLDWDDVFSWMKPDGTTSYKIEIRNATPTDPLIDLVSESLFIPPSCNLKSGVTHNWTVQACCGSDPGNCGPESSWGFDTNLAPEPKSPPDPDWQGPDKTKNISDEESEKLKWCTIEDQTVYEETIVEGEKHYRPLSYKILVYHSEEDLCHPQLSFGNQCVPEILSPNRRLGEALPPDEFSDSDHVFFTKETPYAWQVATCKGANGENCSDYSQLWGFETGSWDLSVSSVSPPDDTETPVGLPVILRWPSEAANSFNYEVIGIDSGKTKDANIALDFPQLLLNAVYSWRVQPCWDYESEDCEDWEGLWSFRTTGAPPKLNFPSPGADGVPIAVNFDWEDFPGAKSYLLKVSGDGLIEEIVVDNKSEFSLDFPQYNVRQEKTYAWQVKTCAHRDGEACGDYSASRTFTTFRLPAPSGPSPTNGGQLSTATKFISWGGVSGAKAYQYQIKYLLLAENETDEACLSLAGQSLFENPETVYSNRGFIELMCLGEYQWQARACLDRNCQETGEWSESWNFSLVETEEGGIGGGLVPCGRSIDNPNTPWNERKSCQIEHLFIMLFVVVNFLFLRVMPLILVLLGIYTGGIFYFSLGKVTTLSKVKSLWKAAGIGLGIIFFAWTIVSFFLTLFGYQTGIFGDWWQIF